MSARRVAGGDPSTFIRERLVQVLKPKANPYKLVRLGGSSDGAYMVPAELLPSLDACFSAGCENRKLFEDELLGRFGLDTFLLDKSSNADDFVTPLVPGKQFFTKKWLAKDSDEESVSLADWVQGTAYGESRSLLLQLDVEEAEFAILSASTPEILNKFAVLVVEFHGLSKRVRNSEFHREVLGAMHALENSFSSIHARANNCCEPQLIGGDSRPFPQVVEVTLVRNDLMVLPGLGRRREASIPLMEEISRNVRDRRPQHLGSEWRDGSVTASSMVKITLDWLTFLPHIAPFLVSEFRRIAFLLVSRILKVARNVILGRQR